MSAPTHTALSAQQFVIKNVIVLLSTLPVHPISPQATFLLLPQMKKVLKGKHFANVEEVKQKWQKH